MSDKTPLYSLFRAVGLLSGVGFMLVLSTLAGYGLGWLVDYFLGLDLFKFLGVLFGAAAGLLGVIRLVRSVEKDVR